MRLLDRYLLRELMLPFGYCLSGFFIFWIAFDLLSEMEGFQQQKLEVLDITEYYVFKSPEFLMVVLPIALLLALLYALSNHARHHELTAIRATGVSLGRLAAPYLGVGLVCTLSLLYISEWVAPEGADAAEDILTQHAADPTLEASRTMERKLGFHNTREKRLWMIATFNLLTCEMTFPHVSWTLPDGTRKEIWAERAWCQGEGWVFTNVQMQVYAPGATIGPPTFETNVLVFPEFRETPEEIKSEIKVGKINSLKEARRTQLSIREIMRYQRLHPGETSKQALLETKLHGRLAGPWTCLVVVLIALPFGAATGRRNVFVGVASSILICFVFFVLQQLTLALGTGGFLPPWLAAWAPNMVFSLAGVLLSWRIR